MSLLQAGEATVPVAISDGSQIPYPISGFAIKSSPLVEIGSDPTVQNPTAPQIQNVTISGIAFAYSNWVDPSYYGYVPYQDGYFVLNSASGVSDDATMQIPAVRIENATKLSVTGNFFEHLGGAGLEIYDQSRSDTISGNTFSDISGNGIIADGDPVDAAPPGPYGTGLGYHPLAVSASDTISDNTISTVGVAFADSSAIQASYTDNLSIKNNDIHDIPESGISLGVLHGGFVTIPKPGSATVRLPTSYTLADVEWNNIYQFGEMLEDGGGIYVDGPNWKGAGGRVSPGTLVENNYIHDNPFSQQDGSPSQVIGENGFPEALSSYAIYLETGSFGASVVANDTFDIRSGSGTSSQNNHATHLSAGAGPKTNALVAPVNDSNIVDNAGPNRDPDLDQFLYYGAAPVSYALSMPYVGAYQVALRVFIVGAPCRVNVSVSGSSGTTLATLPSNVNPYSMLLPLTLHASQPNSTLTITFRFVGGKSASLLVDHVWLVPTLIDPYAT